jgi:hypothetical protein
LTTTRTQKITQTKKTNLKHNAQKELSFTAKSVGHEQLKQKQAHAKTKLKLATRRWQGVANPNILQPNNNQDFSA